MKELFNEYVKSVQTYIMFRIKEATNKLTPELKSKNRAPISLAMGAPTAAPPKYVVDKLKDILSDDTIHTYSSPKGEEYFCTAIAKRMQSRFNVELNPKTEIYSLIGSKEGIANLIRAIINPVVDDADREIILVPDPSYASYREMVKVSGGKSYTVPLTAENNFMPNMDEIWEKLLAEGVNPNKVKAFLMNYPSNPIGATANLEYFKHVVEFCKKHNILLISDAAYTDIYFDKNNLPPSVLQIEGAKDVAVEFFSFSKPYALTGWRLGWVCGNADVISTFGKLKTTIDTGIFKALQKACAELINSKEGDEYIEKSNAIIKQKRDIFLKGLEELGWDMSRIMVPDASFYLWVPMPVTYNSSEQFAQDLLTTSGIVVVPGEGFGEYGKGYVRVSLVCSVDELNEVLNRMKLDGFTYTKKPAQYSLAGL